MSRLPLATNFQVLQHSRIEALATQLAADLLRHPPASVLTPQTLVVGHPGMLRWLERQLAVDSGLPLPRIAANLELLLPWQWLDRLAQEALPAAERSGLLPWRQETLRWVLDGVLARIERLEIRGYLAGESVEQRRFQLADRLAAQYTRYLLYRPEWLADWEAERTPATGPRADHWQAEVWRQLRRELPGAHRAQRAAELKAALTRRRADPEQPLLPVFGVSHLSPDVLNALAAVSAHTRVRLYFASPVAGHFERGRRRAAPPQQTLQHPLLGALGQMGADFQTLLTERGADFASPEIEAAVGDAPLPLLLRLQASLRYADPALLDRPGPAADPRADASLRVHACHTRLRELEVLKDALLDRLAADPTLAPRDIAVLAPDMGAYAPMLAAVFGPPADPRALLPWRLSDVPLARTHPLLTAFRQLLDLATLRLTRSEVQSLIELPAVAQALGLSVSGQAALGRWLARAHVHWGLDALMKAEVGAAAVDDHSFAFGLDRMYAGILLGATPRGEADEDDETADDGTLLLDEHILPVAPVQGPDMAAIGALASLLARLAEWRRWIHGPPHPPAEWAARLGQLVAGLFAAPPEAAADQAAIDALLRCIGRLAEQVQPLPEAPDVPWAVIREVLIDALEGVPERQPFLTGGITFSGMVPQRSIPFRVIAVLGLNDGEFPRGGEGQTLDLIRLHPQVGDRDTRSEDRYLFLEVLMSARDALHLSYLGHDPRDGGVQNPALPLAELMDTLGRRDDAPWWVRHPLQPWDARYYDGRDPALYSYAARWLAAERGGDWRFEQWPTAPWRTSGSDGAVHLDLSELIGLYRSPAKWLARHWLRFSREALDPAEDRDSEPLGIRADRYELDLEARVFSALELPVPALPDTPPADFRRSGIASSGALGAAMWEDLRRQAEPWIRSLSPQAAFRHTRSEAIAIDLRLDARDGLPAIRLTGSLSLKRDTDDTLHLVLIHQSALHFGPLLATYAQWAALRLARPDQPCALLLAHAEKGNVSTDWPAGLDLSRQLPEQLEAGLRTLLKLALAPDRLAGRYFPRTSWAWILGDADKAEDAWEGDYNPARERDAPPGYAALFDSRGELFGERAEEARAVAGVLKAVLAGTLPSGLEGTPR
jgi:exodeoxyribonuclease V gamma subunit